MWNTMHKTWISIFKNNHLKFNKWLICYIANITTWWTTLKEKRLVEFKKKKWRLYWAHTWLFSLLTFFQPILGLLLALHVKFLSATISVNIFYWYSLSYTILTDTEDKIVNKIGTWCPVTGLWHSNTIIVTLLLLYYTDKILLYFFIRK